MSSNLKALHTYFYLLQEHPKKKEKKRIIELMITENHVCDPGMERKVRRTLPLGNFQKKKRKKEKTNVSEGRSPKKIDHVSVWAGRP
jgi:hypothetical protein